jgi:hypothetical protein
MERNIATKSVKIVVPYNYEEEPGRILVDFRDRLSIDFEGVEVKEAYYASMAEEIVIHATVEEDRYPTLVTMYRKGEPVVKVNQATVGNGRLEINNQGKWL